MRLDKTAAKWFAVPLGSCTQKGDCHQFIGKFQRRTYRNLSNRSPAAWSVAALFAK